MIQPEFMPANRKQRIFTSSCVSFPGAVCPVHDRSALKLQMNIYAPGGRRASAWISTRRSGSRAARVARAKPLDVPEPVALIWSGRGDWASCCSFSPLPDKSPAAHTAPAEQARIRRCYSVRSSTGKTVATWSFSWAQVGRFALAMQPEHANQPNKFDQQPVPPHGLFPAFVEAACGWCLFRDTAEDVFERAQLVSPAVQERVKRVPVEAAKPSSSPVGPVKELAILPSNRTLRAGSEISH